MFPVFIMKRSTDRLIYVRSKDLSLFQYVLDDDSVFCVLELVSDYCYFSLLATHRYRLYFIFAMYCSQETF